LISEWTPAWSEPYGFGHIYRERSILRYPQNGGDACPTELKDEQDTGVTSFPFLAFKNSLSVGYYFGFKKETPFFLNKRLPG